MTDGVRAIFGAACVLVLALGASRGAAQEPGAATDDVFAQAEARYAEADLEPALAGFEAAWRQGVEETPQLALVHLRMGTLHAMLGRPEQARSHFRVAVALDPSLEVPPELSPPLQPLFTEAMDTRVPYELEVEIVRTGPPTEVRVTASASLEGVAEALSITVAGDAPRVPSADAPFDLTLPLSRFAEDDTVAIQARALDAHGGVLAETRLDVQRPAPRVAVAFPDAPPAPLPGPARPPEEGDGGVFASPWFWLTTALVVLAVGGLTVGLAVGLGEDVYAFGTPTVMR